MRTGNYPHETSGYPMQTLNRELILSKLHELCPEFKQLNIQPIVLTKGNRY
jgi:hypothetical protein